MAYPTPRPPRFALRVGRSSSGLGLFAAQDIPANRFVIEYRGKLVPDEEAQRIGGRYLFELENGKTILGATRANTARYANHACDPNCEVRIVGNRVFIFSLKKIPAGEPITYDYGKEYFNALIKPYGCLCAKCVRHRKNRQA